MITNSSLWDRVVTSAKEIIDKERLSVTNHRFLHTKKMMKLFCEYLGLFSLIVMLVPSTPTAMKLILTKSVALMVQWAGNHRCANMMKSFCQHLGLFSLIVMLDYLFRAGLQALLGEPN